MKENWKIDEDIKNKYIEKCRLFAEDDEAFKNFKQDKDYGMILEGNSEEVGVIAEHYLRQHGGSQFYEDNLKKFKENDLIGNPLMPQGISPATMRYINTAWEIKSLLGDFQPKRILEIGGGYGGLCKTLSVVYDFDEYTDKDLPEAESLFLKYMSHWPVNVNTTISGEYDLFIADSSLSECDEETQLMYGELAKKCKYVYVTYNSIHQHGQDMYKKFRALFNEFEIRLVPPIETINGLKDFTNTLLMRKK